MTRSEIDQLIEWLSNKLKNMKAPNRKKEQYERKSNDFTEINNQIYL